MTNLSSAKRELARWIACGALVLILPVLYLIEPIWRFRFGHLPSDRIGHFAGNTFIFVRRRQRDGSPRRTTAILA